MDIKIVKIDGKYAIQKTEKFLWWRDISYLECEGQMNFWSAPRIVRKCCLFYSREDAVKRFGNLIKIISLDEPLKVEEA